MVVDDLHGHMDRSSQCFIISIKFCQWIIKNESTRGADASVEALNMKLTLAYSIAYLLC